MCTIPLDSEGGGASGGTGLGNSGPLGGWFASDDLGGCCLLYGGWIGRACITIGKPKR